MTDDLSSIFSQLGSESLVAFHQLSSVGHLTHTFQAFGHEFTIRTLTIDEEVSIGQLIKHLDGNITQDKALITGIVAASLVTIDGLPAFADPVIDNPSLNLREKYRQISEKWHWPIISKINEQYVVLQEKMYQTLEDIENLSLEGRMSSLESSTDTFAPSKEHPFLVQEDPTNSI